MKRARPIRIEGDIAYVPLTKGYEAVIDASDAPLVAGWCWTALKRDHTVYAYRRGGGHAQPAIYMHRAIIGNDGAGFTDHVDSNGLNNRRANLRAATPSQNQHNKRKPKNNTSGFKGVYQSKETGKWRAAITIRRRTVGLGSHDTPEAAHAAYANASAMMHGEFGRLA